MKQYGDWNCPTCREVVFARHDACRKCGTPKPRQTRSAAVPSGDWTCPHCNGLVFGRSDQCRKCYTWRDDATGVAASVPKAWKADWTCPRCNEWVFGRNDQCRKCYTWRPDDTTSVAVSVPTASRADWTCPHCNDLVFGRNDKCRKCHTPRPDAATGVTTSAAAAPSGDWTCPQCRDFVFGRNDKCRKCSTPKPVVETSHNCMSSSTLLQPLRAGDWRCPKCGDLQFAKNTSCRRCGTDQPRWLGSKLSIAPPAYWSTIDEVTTRPWVVLPASELEMHALKVGLVLGGSLGGRDQRTRLNYSTLDLAHAWRIQHNGLWGKYAMERENIRTLEIPSLVASGISMPHVDLRECFQKMMKALPAELDSTINEVFLSHGSKPESVLPILSGGLNERFSGGLFGNGTYLAEDIAKNDQYCTYDTHYGAHPDLHRILFDETGEKHKGNILFVFLCRVVLGCIIRTQDGATNMDEPSSSIWSSKERELAMIAGSDPPSIHHSLLAETGKRIARFREFVLFHGDRIYPEYLVAYTRK